MKLLCVTFIAVLIGRIEGKPQGYYNFPSRTTGCIGGEKCDECARGYVQRADLSPDHPVLNKTIPYGADPDCIPCGECFSNWDRILTNLETTTKEEVVKAEIVKVTGATGAYTRFFEEMEEKL